MRRAENAALENMLHRTIILGSVSGRTIQDNFAMNPIDPNRHPRNDESEPGQTPFAAWMSVVAVVAIMAAGCLSTFMVLQLGQFRPKVGDIVVFRPHSQDTDTWQMAVPATQVAADGRVGPECSIDPNVAADGGGSIVVEGQISEPSVLYRVHWAGTATGLAAANCGNDADLLVSRTDLQRLASAAGGFGVGDKGIVR
jgi:hypothetical protein